MVIMEFQAEIILIADYGLSVCELEKEKIHIITNYAILSKLKITLIRNGLIRVDISYQRKAHITFIKIINPRKAF